MESSTNDGRARWIAGEQIFAGGEQGGEWESKYWRVESKADGGTANIDVEVELVD